MHALAGECAKHRRGVYDANGPPGAEDHAMSPQHPVASEYACVQLCLRRLGHSIEGTCRDDDSGVTRTFWGWLELISALDTISGASPLLARPCSVTADGDPSLTRAHAKIW
jgi:hypothetical protein